MCIEIGRQIKLILCALKTAGDFPIATWIIFFFLS